MSPLRIFFIGMMGIPGSYDVSVYEHIEDRDDEGKWFTKRFGDFPGISIEARNVCIGDPLPAANEVDGLVLGGSYNSVHDNTEWQQRVRGWLPGMREARIPILAICGSHQLLAHMSGSDVVWLQQGTCAGTYPVELTDAGQSSPLMREIKTGDSFQYANSEHVVGIPEGTTLLANSANVPIAALDYGNHCYSTQFHPEATCEALSTVWRFSRPELMANYHSQDAGGRLVRNFLRIVAG